MRMIPTPGRRPDRPARRFVLGGLLALAVHALVLLLLGTVGTLFPAPPRPPRIEPQAIALRALSSDEWAKNRGNPAATATTPPVVPPEPKDDPKGGQVVETAPGNRVRPEDSKLLAESDNQVEKQTLAKDRTAFYRNPLPRTASPKPSAQPHDAPPLEESPSAGAKDDGETGAEQARAIQELPDLQARDRIALKEPDPDGAGGVALKNRNASESLDGNSSRLRVRPGADEGSDQGARTPGRLGRLRLLPSAALMDEIAGGAPNDHVEGVEEGEQTFLNTRQWRYASFFNRIRESVGTHWNPGEKLRVRDPSGEIYGARDRVTVLAVTLDGDGQLLDAAVVKSSGVDFLDLEAVQSFKRAQPFPHPPAGLLTADSTVRFEFGFFLELRGGAPRLRIYRGPH